MNNWIFLSKEGKDEYINMFAIGSGGRVVNTDDFKYSETDDPIVLRGILKKKIIQKCWLGGRDFYFMDTGYLGNQQGPLNPMGWKVEETVNTIKKYTDRPIEIRDRVKSRQDRVITNTLKEALDDDVHALVTFNSNAATEAILYGYPAFTLSPTHAAKPVSLQDLSMIETPAYPDEGLVRAWASHLAYGQFHISELKDGTAWRSLNGK